MQDQSILSQSVGSTIRGGINEYANELIKEVCLNGDSFSKYQKVLEKRFGSDYYKRCNNLVKEIKRLIENKKFSNSSIINLKYLAKEINIETETIEMLANHFNQLFEKERLQAEEEQRRQEEAERLRRETEERHRQEEADKGIRERLESEQMLKDIKKKRTLSITAYALLLIILLVCTFSYSIWSLLYGSIASLVSLTAFSIFEVGLDKIFKKAKGVNALMAITGIYVALALILMSPWWLGLIVTIAGAGIVLLTLMYFDGAFD